MSTEHPTTSAPVTVSITRRVRPEHADQMTAWVRAGSALAERFPGFLGTGWVRPAESSDEWHMLYRFDGPDSLATWEASDERRWWLGAAQGLVEDYRKERLTGIEGWFDPPQEYVVEQLAGPGRPPRWKQAVMIWFAFFPLSLLTTVLVSSSAPELPTVLRVLVSTLVMTPIMTYLVLPFLTSRLEWWLQGQPAPWRGGDDEATGRSEAPPTR
ncbi:antibiotic biosynthesis monooxygenase [Nocardioides coralli]|uniref:antibiotic biosynthesis monooxygenase n=1 Tax=Nocardioides coralli TaxID=2872154 RepID=UPI001CA39EE5|nr:antibiotic biosynthesis monooxygenase [Nocardioides coralli]QZY29501.1 antibiotic biosynthesis monooxygenase [Nocardioides coralli]